MPTLFLIMSLIHQYLSIQLFKLAVFQHWRKFLLNGFKAIRIDVVIKRSIILEDLESQPVIRPFLNLRYKPKFPFPPSSPSSNNLPESA